MGKRRAPTPAPGPLDPEFASAMQAIEVIPLDEDALPPADRPVAATKPLGRRHRRAPSPAEVERSVPTDEAAIFRRAMANLGLDADGRPAAPASTPQPTAETETETETADRVAADPAGETLVARRPAPESREPAVSSDDQRLFAEAMAALDQVPNKDRPTPPTPAPVKPRKIRRPKARSLEIEATLDLHRERQARAIERLRDFLVGAAARGLRRVLVITGKGNHSEGGQGVLRRAVEAWLIRYGTPWVTRFAEAPREMGGSGAWVLELRP